MATTLLNIFFLLDVNLEKYTKTTFFYCIFYSCKIYKVLKNNNYVINQILKF